MLPVRTSSLPSYLSLFGSIGTLVCCALPSLFVLAGLGTTVAAVLSAAPWLVTLSRHKAWVFGASGALIVLGYLYEYRVAPTLRARMTSCAVEVDGVACSPTSAWSRALLWVSVSLYVSGLFAAYLLGPLLMRMSE